MHKHYDLGLDVLAGHGGHGGHGGHHGGHGFRGGRGGWGWGPWGGYVEPDYQCIRWAPDGTCLQWAPVSAALEILGAFDINVVHRNMSDLRPVTVKIAEILARSADGVIAQAIAASKQPWYRPDLPREKARETVRLKLIVHDETLKALSSTPNAVYPAAEELKNLVVQAYEEANAVAEGNDTLDKAWLSMWKEIQQGIGAVPDQVVRGITGGVPLWVVGVVGTVLTVFGLGGLIWINSAIGRR